MTTAVLGWVGDGPYGDPSRAPFWPFLPICIGVGSRRVLPRPGAAAPSQTLPDWYEIGGLIEAPGKKSGGLCCRFRTKRDQNGPWGCAATDAIIADNIIILVSDYYVI